ncbi:MAG TPA: DedA family protein [Bacillota bacterium]|nr:DedA family protein [Bacillota bacterium]
MEKLIQFIDQGLRSGTLAQWAPLLVFLTFGFSFLEIIILVIPGITTLFICGSLAGMAGLNPVLIILAASAGTASASAIVFRLGEFLGRSIIDSPRYSRWLDSQTFFKIEGWFARYGFWTLLFSRFLPVVRPAVVLTAGILKYPRRSITLALGVSILSASTFFVLLGYTIGERWRWFLKVWQSRQPMVYGGVFLIILILIAYRWLRKRSPKKKFGVNNADN